MENKYPMIKEIKVTEIPVNSRWLWEADIRLKNDCILTRYFQSLKQANRWVRKYCEVVRRYY